MGTDWTAFEDKLRRRIRENVNTARATADVIYKEVAKARVDSYRCVLGDLLDVTGRAKDQDFDYTETV